MKKYLGILMAGAMVFATLPGTASAAGKYPVGYANINDADFFPNTIKSQFNEVSKTDPELDIRYADATDDISKQLDQIDNFITQKVKAIVVVPVDFEGITPGVEKANKAGIPVITLNIQAKGGVSTFVGSKNYDAGYMQGEFMAAKLPKNAKILYLQGTPGLYHSVERLQGFTKAMQSRKDVSVLASLSGHYNRAEGMKITEDWIQKFPQFDGIIAANDQMALGALQALKTANRVKGVMLSGIDGTADAKAAIKAGEMSQSVFQNGKAQAAGAFKALSMLKKGEKLSGDMLIPFESITKENVSKY